MSAVEDPRSAHNPAMEVHTRLSKLGMQLKAYGFAVEVVAGGLIVRNLSAPGCCPGQPAVGDTIGCLPRAGDDGRYWFHTSWRQPIANADRYTDALMMIVSYLGTPR